MIEMNAANGNIHFANGNSQNKNTVHEAIGVVNITCFTDPLCCWSWAAEPSWFRLRNQFETKIKWRYVMGGLLPSLRSNPQASKITSNIQVGPVWMQTSQVSKIPMKLDMWHKDPPNSSYPACIAVKCALLQSEKAAELYLNYTREAVMTRGLNIAKSEVLLLIAKSLSTDSSHILNYDRFEEDWKKGSGCDAFCEDMKLISAQKIERLPTLIMNGQAKENTILVGYQSYTALMEAFEKMTLPVMQCR